MATDMQGCPTGSLACQRVSSIYNSIITSKIAVPLLQIKQKQLRLQTNVKNGDITRLIMTGGSTCHEDGSGVHLGLPFFVEGGRRGSVMVSFERPMVVSYRLSIVIIIELSITIQPQFATEYLRRSNQRGGESVWDKVW